MGQTVENHSSALSYATHVDTYIQEELKCGAMIGPFDHKSCTLHISPFMTREKANSDICHTIMDLRWPKGQEVNDGVSKDKYLGTHFEMHYPTVDKIVS